MQTQPNRASGSARRAEVIAALSLALDLGLGQPMEHMLRSAIIASRLAERMGLSDEQRAVVYYADLVTWLGCHADSPEVSAVFGDEIAYRSATYDVDLSGMPFLWLLFRHVASDSKPVARQLVRASFLVTARQRMTRILASHYASAGVLSDRLGLGSQVREAVGYAFERWDGGGLPAGASRTAIPVEMRIVHLADVAEVHLRDGGLEGALAVARDRSGTQFDPDVVAAFERFGDEIVAGLPSGGAWDPALALAPDNDRELTPDELDELLVALGDFVDLKSPYRHGHSRAVATLADEAARLFGLPGEQVQLVQRAAWVHDLGRMGVSNTIWDKPGPLSSLEHERVRLYPYLTQRIMQRVHGMSEVAALAGLHAERLDGSGYPKGVDATFLTAPARLLAAADEFQSATEPQPGRPALSPDAARDHLHREVLQGRLDDAAVAAVLAAVGRPSPRLQPTRPAGLTARELEVLRLVAIGQSSRQVAATLTISEKTVRNHLEHIYAKVGVSNRVGASLFALEHGVVATVGSIWGGGS